MTRPYVILWQCLCHPPIDSLGNFSPGSELFRFAHRCCDNACEEKYRLGDRAMLCLWPNGQLNTAIREPSRILELQHRLKEWLQELR
jgi:hypothetical protein